MTVDGLGRRERSRHEPSAEDAWARILRFFDQHLRS